jgi:hypothetical protein
MPLYAGKDIDLLIAAINRDNPQLPWALNATDFIYSKPVKYTVANLQDHNTQIRVTAKETSPYRGNVLLTYRRIDLAILFRSQRMELKKFIASNGSLTKAQYIPLLNIKYGLNLDPAQVSGATLIGSRQTQTVTLTMVDNAYQFTGAISLVWTQDLEELGLDVMTTGELAGAVWPNGVGVFDPEGTYSLRHEFLPLYRDYTQDSIDYAWPIVNTQTSFVLTSGANPLGLKTLLKEMSDAYGLNMEFEAQYDVSANPRGLMNRTLAYRCAPITTALKATYPFVNREGATHVMIVWLQNHPIFGNAAMGYLPFYFNA